MKEFVVEYGKYKSLRKVIDSFDSLKEWIEDQGGDNETKMTLCVLLQTLAPSRASVNKRMKSEEEK